MDKEERESMGRNAVRAIKEEFSQEKLRNLFIEVLEETIN